ncbi:MAG: FAD-binding protein [Methanosarcina sp.]|jgi:glycine/D-amino acid oxidase-like deaminating enzyme
MKKIIIIGGGIAGLSAGIFAQKNGFESSSPFNV